MSLNLEKFLTGIIDFFGIILPGAILTFFLQGQFDSFLLSERNPFPHISKDHELVAFLIVAYIIGHFINAIGARFLDDRYDRHTRKKFNKNFDLTFLAARKIRDDFLKHEDLKAKIFNEDMRSKLDYLLYYAKKLKEEKKKKEGKISLSKTIFLPIYINVTRKIGLFSYKWLLKLDLIEEITEKKPDDDVKLNSFILSLLPDGEKKEGKISVSRRIGLFMYKWLVKFEWIEEITEKKLKESLQTFPLKTEDGEEDNKLYDIFLNKFIQNKNIEIINTYKFTRRILLLQNSDALEEVNRLEADQKFFRGLVITFLTIAVILIAKSVIYLVNGDIKSISDYVTLLIPLLFLFLSWCSYEIYAKLRYKNTELAYQFIISMKLNVPDATENSK